MENLLREINSLLGEVDYKISLFEEKAEDRVKKLKVAKDRLKKESDDLYNRYMGYIKSGEINKAEATEIKYEDKEDVLQSIGSEIYSLEDILEELNSIKSVPRYVLSGFDKYANDQEVNKN